MGISVIVGLGNPGDSYAATRHNVGFWLLDRLAADAGATLKAEKKVLGYVAQAAIANNNVRLLRPATYMNESGQSVRRMLDFYKVDADQLLVLHDELDLPPGTVRMKKGGGHGGHNGLRDIIAHCGKDFMRVRIGVGHPGDKSQVTNFVLKPPKSDERKLIEDSLLDTHRAIEILRELRKLDSPEFVFPSTQPGKPLSEGGIVALLRRMEITNATPHGFRSSFRDWAGEQTNHPREVAEAALAHVVGDQTEAAYRRGDALEKRRRLMTAWAGYCSAPTSHGPKVVKIRERAS